MTPKIELHVHLEGTIRPATLLEIARRNDQPLPADTVSGVAKLYEFTDFAHFIDVWILTTSVLRTGEDFRRIALEYAEEAASFGAVYLEGIFSPGQYVSFYGVSFDEIFAGFADAADEAYERHGVIMRYTPDLYRGMDPAVAEEQAHASVRYRDRGVVGLGLGGLESRPLEPYLRSFAIARDGGLGIVPHAGEAAGAESVREILALDPDRIRHGIRSIEDPGVLAEILERGLVLDVCPTSNVRTGVVPSLAEHPLPKLRAAGVPCTINTDDPAMFGTNLAREHEAAAELGLTSEDAYAAGLAGALCEGATRAHLASLSPPTP
jgi:aminodeoxyfutalosine deaminase